jgi:uncharacterized membrane protein YfcA
LNPVEFIEIFLVGVVASIFGSIVGMGGGFIVIPLLRLGFGVAPSVVAGTSLLFVLANVATSAIGYIKQKRVDFSLAVPISIGGIPGSIAGVLIAHRISAAWFDYLYGALLVGLFFLVIRRRAHEAAAQHGKTFAHVWGIAIAAGVVLGLFSSLFGIGGGIVMVPLLLVAAKLPPHVVSATSGFIILCTAPVGVIAHGLTGDIDWLVAVPLTIGGLVGGYLAPYIAKRISSPGLVKLLAFALLVAAAGLVLKHFA